MVSMLERFRKKSLPINETTEDVAAALSEQELEASTVTPGDEIEQARQDLMRAAMESIAIPTPKNQPSHAGPIPTESNDEDIPVIQVKVNHPKSPVFAKRTQLPSSPPAAKPAAETESLVAAPPEEPPSVPVESAVEELKEPKPVEEETVEEPPLDMVSFRTDPLVTEPEPESPQTKEIVHSREPHITQLDDIMINIVKQDIASHRQRIFSPK